MTENIQKMTELFDSMFVWEKREFVDMMCCKAHQYGINTSDYDENAGPDIEDAFDAVSVFGADDLLDEMDLQDLVKFFGNHEDLFNELVEELT